MKVWLDPGHGGNDPGCTADGGEVTEARLVYEISREMLKLGQGSKIDYALSRVRTERASKLARAARAHAFKAEAALVLHFNAIEDRRVNRTDLFSIGKVHPFFERAVLDLGIGIPMRHTSVTKDSQVRVWNCLQFYQTFKIPAILIEIAFLDRELTLAYLADGGVEKIAKSLHDWVLACEGATTK